MSRMHIEDRDGRGSQPALPQPHTTQQRSFIASSFRPLDEEELTLHPSPATKTGYLGVQEVDPGCYQAKIRRKSGRGFVSLPACNSVLLAAWFFAKAFKAREDGMLETSNFKACMKEVRSCQSLP